MPAKKTTTKVAAKKTATKTVAKKAPAKKAAKAIEKNTDKAVVKPAAKKAVSKKTTASYETIAHAAYLNYRRRMDLGLPGDHDTDWLEAEKSLGIRS